MRTRVITAILAALSLLGLGVTVAPTASANDIRPNRIGYGDCRDWQDAGAATGYVRIQVRGDWDLTPNPDKFRPREFKITNNTNKTASFYSASYLPGNGGASKWATSYAAGPGIPSYPIPLYAGWYMYNPDEFPVGDGGTSNPYDTQWWRHDLSGGAKKVMTHGPINNPWWLPVATTYAPYVEVGMAIGGHFSYCRFFVTNVPRT